MRPRVFPAEDLATVRLVVCFVARFNEAAGIPRGRHLILRFRGSSDLLASMRPRVFPAEDLGAGRSALLGRDASMRPRVFPAEDGRGA